MKPTQQRNIIKKAQALKTSLVKKIVTGSAPNTEKEGLGQAVRNVSKTIANIKNF